MATTTANRKSETMATPIDCETWEEAYDMCRERDRPVRVRVCEDGVEETGTVYPSGRFRPDTTQPERVKR